MENGRINSILTTYIISDKVSSEIMITNNISQLSLKNSASEWANCILTSDCKRNNFAFSELQKAGYDIKNEAMNLQNFYVDLYNKIGSVQKSVGSPKISRSI